MRELGPLEIARLRVKSLKLSSSALKRAEMMLNDVPKPAEALSRYRKEWINDTIALGGHEFEKASANPDQHFLAWIDRRHYDPQFVPLSAVERAAEAWSGNEVVPLLQVTWPQELAWADFLLASDDDDLAAAADLFIEAVRRNPGLAFFRLVETVRDLSLERIDQMNRSTNQSLTPDEIRDGKGELPWRPFFVDSISADFKLEPKHLIAFARRGRARAKSRQQEVLRRRIIEAAEKPMALLNLHILKSAAKHGLSSDQLVSAQDRFRAYLNGNSSVDLSEYAHRPLDLFADYLASVPGTDAPNPNYSFRDKAIAINSVRARIRLLPAELAELGASSRGLRSSWESLVVDMLRTPHRNPLIDYALYVVECSIAHRVIPEEKKRSGRRRKASA